MFLSFVQSFFIFYFLLLLLRCFSCPGGWTEPDTLRVCGDMGGGNEGWQALSLLLLLTLLLNILKVSHPCVICTQSLPPASELSMVFQRGSCSISKNNNNNNKRTSIYLIRSMTGTEVWKKLFAAWNTAFPMDCALREHLLAT